MEFDEEFQEEFDNIVSDDNIKEADATFTPDVFDETYLRGERPHSLKSQSAS